MTLLPALDLFPLLASCLVLVGCALLGNFLVLRRQSLMGDTLSHSVLPGVVGAYLLFGDRDPLGLFFGALVAGGLTVVSIEGVRRIGRIEANAAMGVVFSVAFAIGVVLIRTGSTDHVDLDPNCVLYGQLELLVWYDAPNSFSQLQFADVLSAAPPSILSLVLMVSLSTALVVFMFKELRLASFDPGLAMTLGFSAPRINMVLMLLVSIATVASFEAVGSVLVITALIASPSTSRLLTDRLLPQIVVSVAVALISAILGYVLSTWLPSLWGGESLKASGMITVISGGIFVAALLFSPRHGVIIRRIRSQRLAEQIAVEDVVVMVHAARETGAGLAVSMIKPRILAKALRERLLTSPSSGEYVVTSRGRDLALMVQKRRSEWMAYLVDEVGLAEDHAPSTAEHLEHLDESPVEKPDEHRDQHHH